MGFFNLFKKQQSQDSNKNPFVISGSVLLKYKNKDFCGEVYIPEFITEVADKAFTNCHLSKVVFPKDCKYIKKGAFAFCENLKNIIFLCEENMWIDDGAFMGCTALEEIHLPKLFHEGNGAFESCSALRKVSFDHENRTIGKAMFKDCISLVDLNLPQDLYSIQGYAFSGCVSIREISLPDTVEKIAPNAFEYCTSLTTINLPSKIKAIQENTFLGCRCLQTVHIAEGISIIENNAFRDCNIDSVSIPSSVLNLGEQAFDNNTKICGYKARRILFPDANKDIIGLPSVGEHIEPIYYRLFKINPRDGYEVAFTAINLMNGHLHRIDSKQVSYGFFLGGEDDVSGLSFKDWPQIATGTKYANMTSENWKDFIPKEELEKAANNNLAQRSFDDTFRENDDIEIDGLYIKLQQRFGVRVFYFRKTQTGYRLYSARKNGRTPIISFDETKCTEEYLYSVFISFKDKHNFTFADKEKDVALFRDEFYTIINSAPELFGGKYSGKEKCANFPISIYGDDRIEAVLWKNGKAIPCTDYPEIKKVYDALVKCVSD